MTLLQAITEADRLCNQFGSSALATADQKGLCGRRLRTFVEDTRCLFHEKIELTSKTIAQPYAYQNTALYSLNDSQVADINPNGAIEIIEIVSLTIKDTPIEKGDRLDPRMSGLYVSTEKMTPPRSWFEVSREQWATYPALADAGNAEVVGYIAGFFQHSTITSSSADSTNILIPRRLEELFVDYLLEGYLREIALGDAGAARQEYQARNAQAMAEVRQVNINAAKSLMLGGPAFDVQPRWRLS